MPYLKLTVPKQHKANFTMIAGRLTNEVVNLFYNPKAPVTREELRERTTVHFVPYESDELFIGGRSTAERRKNDITLELSDWHLSVKAQRRIAKQLTPVLAELFAVPLSDIDNVNIRFHSYPPTDFAVGGKLLSDLIPFAARLAKKLFSS